MAAGPARPGIIAFELHGNGEAIGDGWVKEGPRDLEGRGLPPRVIGVCRMFANWTGTGAAIMVLLLWAGPALAAGGAEAGGEAEPSLFGGDLGNAIWTLVIFVCVLIVLGRFAWGPILRALQKREEYIRDSLADAKRQNEETKRILAEHAAKLAQAQQEASAIVDEGRRDADEVRKRILAEAKGQADAELKRAKKEIALARDDAVKQLHDQTIMLATSIAGKLVQRQLTPKDGKALLDEALSEMGRMN